MSWIRWAYHRAGQMTCFVVAAGALAATPEAGLPAAVISAAFLFGGIALKAIHVWQQVDDPGRE